MRMHGPKLYRKFEIVLGFMSALAQVVITWIIIGIEAAILSAVLIKEPADSLLHFPELNRARLICNTTGLGLLAPMGFDFFLIAMYTIYMYTEMYKSWKKIDTHNEF